MKYGKAVFTSFIRVDFQRETLVNAESDGYVNYYQSGQSKIRTGMNICAISPQKLDVSESQEQSETTLSAEEQETIEIVLKAQDLMKISHHRNSLLSTV